MAPPERGHCVGNPLFRTKSIERILADSDAPEHRLKRTLTAWDLTGPVSYTHLRAHETVLDLVCRLLLAKKKKQ